MRSASPPPYPSASMGDYYGYHHSYPNRYSSPVPMVWDRMRSASPPPYSSSYCDDSYHRYPRSSAYHYDDYGSDHRTMIDVTPSWGRYCQSRMPSYDFSPSHRSNTIQVNSEGELDHVLSDLTRNRTSSSFHFY